MADHFDQHDMLLPLRFHSLEEAPQMRTALGPAPSECLIARPQHVEVYRKPGEFAGWPANYGLWIWGNEVVVVFVQGLMGSEGKIHARDRNHPFRPLQARSLDGGTTWTAEPFSGHVPGTETLSADEHVVEALRAGSNIISGRDLLLLNIPIDFLDPETIVMAARTGIQGGAVSWFYVSRDRARTWQGPHAFGDFGLPGIAARTDIIPIAPNEALLLLTAAKADGKEGRIFCARTLDGGRSFSFQGFLRDETDGYAIMPSSVRLPEGRIVTAARRMGAGEEGWIDMFASDDLGITWRQIGGPIPTGFGGNPGALQILPDGRLALLYGYRDEFYGIRLRMSGDGGRTWSPETVVRGDGGSPDLGYPRAVVKPDGSLLCVYYFNEEEDGERFIAASTITPALCTGIEKAAPATDTDRIRAWNPIPYRTFRSRLSTCQYDEGIAMPPMHSIHRPDGDMTLDNSVEAIRPSFDELVRLADISVEAAAGPDMPEALVALARRAESVGWAFDIAQEAIRKLAHEHLGARGAFSD